MDLYTYSGSPSGIKLALILDELPEKTRKRARSTVATALEDARLTTELLVALPNRRIARRLLLLFRRESLDEAGANLPTSARTHLRCVLTAVFRDASRRLKKGKGKTQ